MASNHIRRASLILGLALLTPLASAQKPVSPKPQPQPTFSSVTLPAPSGGFLTGTDSCTTPTPVAGIMMVPFDLTAATTGTQGQGEANCYFFGTSGIDSDVWWCWTPGFTGTGRVRTCNLSATDTKVAIYPGCGCPVAGSSLACNDDACGLQTSVDFAAAAATTYTVQLGTFPGATVGNGTVSFEQYNPPPPQTNDDCTMPDVLPGPGAYTFDLTMTSTGTQGQAETLCYAFGTSGIDNDIWYTYTPNCNGDVTVTTCGLATFDTKIAAYPGAGCPTTGTSVACNDDACGLQSTIIWTASAGSSYTIQVGTFPGAGLGSGIGMFDLSISCGGPTFPPACFGDTGPCGCGNNGGAGEGCRNSTGAGSVLAGSGTASLSGDTMVLMATQTPNQPGIFFQGNTLLGSPPSFGDGIRCCGQSVVRIGTYLPSGNATDTATGNQIGGIGPPISGHPGNSGLMAGDSRCYQWWYRDPGVNNPCGADFFNLSNAVTATWLP